MNQLHIAALSQDLHQTCLGGEFCPYGMGGVLGEPFFSPTHDTGKQQYPRVINVAACQDHIIWIRNYNHGVFQRYNSKTAAFFWAFMDEQSTKLTNATHETFSRVQFDRERVDTVLEVKGETSSALRAERAACCSD